MTFHVISKTTGAKQRATASEIKLGNGICQSLADEYFTELERWQATRKEARRLNTPSENVIDLCAVRRSRKSAP
ncbi:hypothetical protein ACS0OX_17210 [Stenotrophomonas pavanii]|uniref:hypothetical protein n=1 Tax=Stenotrophomonas pavanii TaxID=487698 RepID=UPI003F95BAD5